MKLKNLNLNKQFFSYLATYLVGSWSFIQFVEWFCKRYSFNNNWTDIIALGLVLLLPSALLFSWLHTDEKNKFKKQKLFYTLNIGFLLLVLIPINQGFSISSTTKKVKVKDEHGIEQEIEVSKKEYIRQIAFLPFQNDNKLDWLSIAFPTLISTDINQCKRFNTYSAIRFIEELKKLDYEIKDKLPQNVKEKLTNNYLVDYIVSGTINQPTEDTYQYKIELFNKNLRKITFSTKGQANDLFSITDSLSIILNQQIFEQDLKIKLDDYKNIPSSELFSSNKLALKKYFESNSLFYTGNFNPALTKIKEAISIDKKFAEAYKLEGLIDILNGKLDKGMVNFEKALQFSTPISDNQQREIKAYYYQYKDNRTKTKEFFEMWIKIHPEDIFPFNQLIRFYINNRNLDDAIEVGHKAEDAGHKSSFAFTLASLYARQNNLSKVKKYLSIYQGFFPDDKEIEKKIGDVYYQQGAYSEALKHYYTFKTLNPIDISINFLMSDCQLELGNYLETEQLLKETANRVTNFSDSVKAYKHLEKYYAQRGQIKKAIKLMEERWEFSKNHYPTLPLAVQKVTPSSLLLYYSIGDKISPEKYLEAVGDAIEGTIKSYEYGYRILYYFNTENGVKFDGIYKGQIDFFKKTTSPEMFAALEGYSKKFKGKYKEAIKILAPIANSTSDYDAKYHLYDCYRLTEQYDKAVNGFQSYIEEKPLNGKVLLNYARSLNGNGQVEEAKKVLQRLIKLWENSDIEYIYSQEAQELKEQMNLLN